MRKAIVLLVSICFIGLALAMLPINVGATVVGTAAPVTGDWEISNATVLTGETIELKGNLIINKDASLVIDGTTLKMCCTTDGEYGITVKDGATLTITGDSHLTNNGGKNYFFICEKGATFAMTDSKIEYCGYNIGDTYDADKGWKLSGPYFACDGTIKNSTIDNCFQGIVCEENTFTISDSTVQNSLWHNYEGRKTTNFVIDNCNCFDSVEKCNVEFYSGCTGALKNSVVKGAGHNCVWGKTDCTVVIENNDISGAPYNGIWFADNCDVTITNNKVYGNDQSGIWIEQDCTVTCTGTEIKDNGDTESYTWLNVEQTGHGFAGFDSEVTFNDNVVGNNYGHNFETTNCKATFMDNQFSASRKKCNVEFFEGSDVIAKNNVIDGAGHNCFWMRDNAKAVIEDNIIKNSPHNGIWAGIGCELTIRNNVIENCAENGIYSFNCTLTIENNEIKDCGEYAIKTENCVVTEKENIITNMALGERYTGWFPSFKIVDDSDAILADADVEITDSTGKVVWTGKSDAQGLTPAILMNSQETYTIKATWGDAEADQEYSPVATEQVSIKLKEKEEETNILLIVAIVVIVLILIIVIAIVVINKKKS